ncbi:acyl-CoA synthetase [Achromobacter sp. SD115]|uniref:AMP-binding protein n=1 Tax=Achromobacter sp. SD115 TaxID=2782011 RepID=UPI001A9573AF|nr:AMP-binding protein [Achromobacter sp. SD115]MBO1016968.1 acyl-CoA synthetase [Achromobacter sp. SD115]
MAWTDLAQLLLPAPPDLADALVADEPPLTREAFARASLQAAGALQARSLRRVALWFEDAAQMAIALFACWRAGVVAILPGDAQAQTCATLDATVDTWLSDAELPLPAQRLCRLADLQDGAPLAPAALDPALTLVLCTSGSSGTPKHIAKHWRQLMEEVRALQQQWPDARGPVLGSVSAQHMYGLPFRVLWPLCAGRQLDRPQRLYPEELQQASLRHPACTWIASPALLRRLGQRLDWTRLRGRLTRIHSSGGELPAEASDHIAQHLGLRPSEIYGSSETGAVAWREGGSPWRPLPGVAVDLNGEGALRVRSPWVNPAEAQTADGAELADGGFRLLGRLDRIVKIEEKRISLPMLEQALTRHPYVAEARLGALAGAARLAALVALSAGGLHALRNQGRKAVVDALRAHLGAGFESLAIPRTWRFFAQLPANAQGKLPRSVFEAAAGPRPLAPVAVPLPPPAEHERRYTLEVPCDLAHFSGHFPTAPVVPGVVQIGWAMSLAQRDLHPELRFAGMEALKFQRLLRPGDVAVLALKWDASKQKLYFAFTLNDAPCSSGRILQAGSHDSA